MIPENQTYIVLDDDTDTDGSDNWRNLCDVVNDENSEGNYTAFEFARMYGYVAGISNGNYTTSWYVPSAIELLNVLAHENILTTNFVWINGNSPIYVGDDYWSSSQASNDNNSALAVHFAYSVDIVPTKKNVETKVLVIHKLTDN